MASPRPVPPASRERAPSSAGEPLEDALSVARGDAGAVVDDDEPGRRGALVQRRSSRSLRAWRSALSSRLRTTRASWRGSPIVWAAATPLTSTSTRPRSTAPARLLRARCRRGRPVRAAAGRRRRRCGPAGAGRRRGAGVTRRPRRTLRSVRRVGLAGRRQVDLELGADAGQRAAQLVRRVGDESLLAGDRVVDAVEHLVHRAGQAVDLVAGAGLRHPAAEVGCPMIAAISRSHPLDRAQRAPDQPPVSAAERGDDQRHGPERAPAIRIAHRIASRRRR